MDDPEISVVLPSYNEENTLQETVSVTIETLDKQFNGIKYEIIIAEDGCDDHTPEIASELEKEHTCVSHVHSSERLGRGQALEHAFSKADGSTLAYLDTDLATDMSHLRELINAVRIEDYDVATGSRYMAKHRADRPIIREIPSKGYNFLVRLLFGSEVRDHQCGFKSISKEAFETLSPKIQDEHWFWDTELLVRAQRRGMMVKEFSVQWDSKGDSKVNLIDDIIDMGTQLGRLWWNLNVSGE